MTHNVTHRERMLATIRGQPAGGRHLVTSVSDDVPPDVKLTRLAQIKQRVTDFGPVQPIVQDAGQKRG